MKRYLAILLSALFLLTALPLNGMLSVAADTDDLIVNGDFETGDATGWETWQDTEICADAAHSGYYGAHLRGNGGWGGMLNQTVAVEAGATYTLSFWIHVNAVGVNCQVKDGIGTRIEGAGGWFDANKKDTLVEWTFVATDDSVYINFCGSGIGSAEDIYMDDFSLIKVDGDAPDEPEEPDVPADAILYENFDNGEIGAINSYGDISVVDGALQFDVTADWGNIYTELTGAKANTDYEISFKAKSTLGKSYWIKFNDSWWSDIASADLATSTEWKEYSFTLNSGSFGTLIFLIQCGAADNGEVLWIDDLTIAKAIPDEPEEPDTPSAGGLLVNGDFEDGADGWTLNDSASICDDARTGIGALRLENTSVWSSAAIQTVAVEPNTDYVLKMWTKRVENKGVFDLFLMNAADNRNIQILNGQNWFNTNDVEWTERTIVFHSDDATEMILKWSSETGNAGIILIDDMVLYKEGDKPDEPVEPPVTEGPMYLSSFGTAINRPVTPETNLIVNSSFENAQGGQWQSILSDTLYVVEDETAPEGNKSLYFNTVGVESEDKAIFYVDVEPDTDYVFSVWVKGAFISDNNRFNATVGVVDYRNNFLVHNDTIFSNKHRQIVPPCWDNEWHLRAVSFYSGANTRVGIAFSGSLSQMWVDGMALFKEEDGIQYIGDKQGSNIAAQPELEENGYCAEENNLIPDGGMNGGDAVEFWSQALGYGNGFLSFENGALKYTGGENSCDLHAIRWIDVEPNTDYTFSVDMRILESGDGRLILFDGKKHDYYPFLLVDFDKSTYGDQWFTVTLTFNSGAFDRIGIAVMDGGGAALIDDMRLFESRYRTDKPIETGDVNGDGQINNRDLGLLMQYLSGWDVYVEEHACDMDGNGKLNNKDLGLLQRLLIE